MLLILKKTDILCPRTFADAAAEEPRRDLTVKLYKSLLLFLIKTACYYNRNRIGVLLSDSIKLNDWDAQLKNIRDADSILEAWLKAMTPLTTEDNECLSKLQLTNPSRDKKRIEATAGSLFRDCYRWVLDHEAYQKWRNEDEGILWIKGGPGKGKTMLLCGIINELASLRSMSYFFCQAAYDKTNNNAPAVLRGLIWMLADRNSSLIRHIKQGILREADSVYNDHNSFLTLSDILRNMLQDMDEAVLVVDALDECNSLRGELIELIKETSRSYNVKWLVSSRDWPVIEERLRDVPKLSLEIEKSIGNAVQSYITLKISELTTVKGYDQETAVYITEFLSKHADDTFLWVALVCTNLNAGNRRTAKKMVEELPPTLDALYNRMLERVTTSEESQTLSRVLAAATHVHRPVSILELGNIMEISDDNLKYIDELVKDCGSFLTIQDNIIEFVHKSAQDYIKKHLKLTDMHQEIYHCSMRAMSRTLKRNIYELDDIASDAKDLQPPDTDPLVSIAYCCLYWAQHLERSASITSEISAKSSLSTFFYKHYLFWLEAVSLLQDVPQASTSMHILYNITKVLTNSMF